MTEHVEIYSVHESGVSDSWQWVVMLSRHDTGGFRMSIDQVLWDSSEDGEGVGYELPVFTTGAELFEFAQSSWLNDHEEGLNEEDWRQIESNVRAVDKKLAEQVGQVVQLAFGHKAIEKTSEQLQIEKCIDAATWERNAHAGGGAMWAALAETKQMNQAVTVYVQEHHNQHGTTPQGTHLISGKEVTFTAAALPERAKS